MDSLPSRWRRTPSLWLILCLVLNHLAVVSAAKPNFIVILTDDQDDHMESVQNMPQLQQLVVSQGTTFTNHFCTIALCCPSRVNMWTGRYAHNTNVTDVEPPLGGYPKVVEQNINNDYLPIWLQELGYSTYYTGKLWNAHTVKNYNSPFVNGFDGSDFHVGPQQYDYWNSSFVRNGEPPVYETGKYTTDVLSEKAYGFLQEALAQKKPWFLVAAPVAPHVELIGAPHGAPPPAALRHSNMFQDYIIPRTDNFNPDKPGGATYYSKLEKLNQTVIDYNDEFQRQRLRALQSVDDMVGNLTQSLSDDVLENTYIIYTTDNGYHLSQHRMFAGKRCGLDTDIKIPFIIRGPGLPAGATDSRISSHVDFSPTVMSLVGADAREEFDGVAMGFTTGTLDTGSLPGSGTTSGDVKPTGSVRSTSNNTSSASAHMRGEHVAVEHWGKAVFEGRYGQYGHVGPDRRLYRSNTYKSVRIVGKDYSLYYSVWCKGDHELYDMRIDPGQLDNLYADEALAASYNFANRPVDQLAARLDALLMVLKSCAGDSCRRPWRTLFPGGQVNTLMQAMNTAYDAFFDTQPPVAFDECDDGYFPEVEGHMDPNIFGTQRLLLGRDSWMGEPIWNMMD